MISPPLLCSIYPIN